MTRVAAFIDGFNVYHAVNDLKRPHLKWVDLRKVLQAFIDPKLHTLDTIYYFSAYATWLPGAYLRHQAYVAALQSSGVTPILGTFKAKDRGCNSCGAGWKAHEEKESDVNIALYMLRGAARNEYDEAFLVTGDSDLVPAVKMIKNDFPTKRIKIIIPPGRRRSNELFQLAHKEARMQEIHLERALFPAIITDVTGKVIATRPTSYDPPLPPAPKALLPAKP